MRDCLPPDVWPQPGPAIATRARLRTDPEDFRVDEVLGFTPEGDGEHAFVQVRKRGCNTAWVARQLAQLAGVRVREVSYAGLKDRDAVTSQWFSVWLPGRPDPDWHAIDGEQIQVLGASRHRRKLRRGFHRGNRFTLVLRRLQGDRAGLDGRLQGLAAGVPNYFGPQRFGHGGANLTAALALFRGTLECRDRHRRGLYLSAARSLLFNRILALRVQQGSWDRALDGEVLMLDGSHSVFSNDRPDTTIERRLAEGDIHPTAALWGVGESMAGGRALAVERQGMQGCELFQQGLEAIGMRQERRALRLRPTRLEWEYQGSDALRLAFTLPSGGFATALVEALVRVDADD